MRAGKSFRFDIAAADDADALAQATVVADRLLANPVIEESAVTVHRRGRTGRPPDGAPASGWSCSRAPTASTMPSWPCERLGASADLVWHGDTSVAGYDALVLPGGFAHGDYLRPGAIARFSPVMEAVGRFAAEGGPVVGICNGFQVLTEAGLLPGALQKNSGLRFLCTTVAVRVESADSVLTAGVPSAPSCAIPINHFEGNYTCDAETLAGSATRTGSSCATWTTPTARSTTSPGSATRPATWSASCPIPNGPRTRCSVRSTARSCSVPCWRSAALRAPGPESARRTARAGASAAQLRVRGIFACCSTEALTPTVRHAEYEMPLRSP